MGFVSSCFFFFFFLWWIVDRSPGQKHPLRLCCNLAPAFPSHGVLLWEGRPGSPAHGGGGGPDAVLLMKFLAKDDQQEPQNPAQSWPSCCRLHVPVGRCCLPVLVEGVWVLWEPPISQDHVSSRWPAGPSEILLYNGAAIQLGSPWCWHLRRGLSPPAGALPFATCSGGPGAPLTCVWTELVAGGGHCKYL